MTKEEILTQMKVHQAEYSKLNEEYKVLKAADEKETHFKKQQGRLELFKSKYNFFAHEDGKVEPINWETVATNLAGTTSMEEGYILGWDETGMPGMGHAAYNGGTFLAMVEEEGDVRKYLEREAKRKEVVARRK